MKKLLLLAIATSFSLTIFAQGINFEHSTFNKALAKAKAENKMLFVDFYTSWCGPCKRMAKEVFPNEKVAAYFNKNFISLKIDAEKGEGIELSKKYRVAAFPSLLFFNPDGTENRRMRGALVDVNSFINFAKEVKGEVRAFTEKYEDYEKGERKPAFIRDLIASSDGYIMTLTRQGQKEWMEKINRVGKNYLASHKAEQLLNKDDFSMIARFLDGPNNGNAIVEHIYDNYELWAKVIPKEELDQFVCTTNNKSIHEAYRKADLKFRKYLEDIKGRLSKAYKQGSYQTMKYVSESSYSLLIEKNVDAYFKWSHKLTEQQKKEGQLNAMSYVAMGNMCLHYGKEFITKKQLNRLMNEMKEGVKLDPKSFMLVGVMGDIHAQLGNKKKAIEHYQKLKEMVKEDPRRARYYNKIMDQKIKHLQ